MRPFINWQWVKHANFRNYLCWLCIISILTYYAFILPGHPLSYLFYTRPWPLCSLLVLVTSFFEVYLVEKEKERQIKEQSEIIGEQAVALEQANAKVDFLLEIIHDLRTPLTAILSALPLLETGQNISGWLQNIRSAATYLLEIVTRVMVQAKTGKLFQEPLSLRDWAVDTVGIVTPAAQAKDITLKIEIDEQLPDCIQTNPTALTRIMTNLLDNAIAFTARHKTITISCKQDADRLSLCVINEAITEMPEALFEPYVSQKNGGTGLGLAVVYSLVRQMGGEVSVHKIAEKNCTAFKLDLPLVSAEPLVIYKPVMEEPLTMQVSGEGVHILLLEDDVFLQSVVMEHLLRHGSISKVTATGEGRRGIEYAAHYRPDVIIVDDQLADMTGLAVIKRLQLIDHLAGVPVIVVSGNPDVQVCGQYFEAGVSAFFSKPFDMKSLTDTIRQMTES